MNQPDLAALRQQSLVSLDQRLDAYHSSAIRQFVIVAAIFGCLLLAALLVAAARQEQEQVQAR